MHGQERTTGATAAPSWETLEAHVRGKLQEWIQDLLEEEVTELLGRKKSERRKPVDALAGYRNGYGKPRQLTTSAGTITVRRPRVRDLEERFESRVLPFFKRRTKGLDEALPELYLHGLAEGDFDLALRGLLGDGAPISASSIARLKAKWQGEYEAWRTRDLAHLDIVYMWCDGIYVKAGLEKDKAALLVVIGADRAGNKHVLAVESGARESTRSWSDVLRSLKHRELRAPKLLIGDGHLGIWAALREIYPETDEQRCWNHRVLNVLDKVPKRLEHKARALVCAIPEAETQAEAVKRRDRFANEFGAEFPKAVETVDRDWERMVAFYRYPKGHWKHIRTSNVVESPFASARLRTDAAKRYKKTANATVVLWKLLLVAEKNFRKLHHYELLPKVINDVKFKDGIEEIKLAGSRAA